uniref:Uncharacterized protein n=1 Tax=uncultured marine bacterium Ant24C4 TaxID=360425 RepID=Q2PYD5_9BACT|nr:hypothetical protein [uncultured marine bacterium Ant24C4]
MGCVLFSALENGSTKRLAARPYPKGAKIYRAQPLALADQ